jgi:hypothetical protein
LPSILHFILLLSWRVVQKPNRNNTPLNGIV